MSDPQLFPHGEPPAAAQPAIGQVWNAPDGRRLRVVGTGARIGLRNVETNRLTYMALRHFRPTEKWHLTIEPEAVAPAAALSPTFPIPLNEKQEAVVKLWALPTTPGMWGSPETVEFNLRTFARKILAESAALSPSEEPKK